jgi:ankyrin repeat domain-containing protein 50
MRQWSLPGLHLLVTSRDVVDIGQALDVEAQNMVALKNDNVSQDILRYVSHQVDHDPQLGR